MTYFFDPEIYLEIAKNLRPLKALNFDGRMRTGIGRAYYAAFLKSMHKLQGLGEKFQNVSSIHSDVRVGLNRKKKGNIASKLYSLFQMRVRADYKLNTRINISDYDKSITLSDDIITKIDEL